MAWTHDKSKCLRSFQWCSSNGMWIWRGKNVWCADTVQIALSFCIIWDKIVKYVTESIPIIVICNYGDRSCTDVFLIAILSYGFVYFISLQKFYKWHPHVCRKNTKLFATFPLWYINSTDSGRERARERRINK